MNSDPWDGEKNSDPWDNDPKDPSLQPDERDPLPGGVVTKQSVLSALPLLLILIVVSVAIAVAEFSRHNAVGYGASGFFLLIAGYLIFNVVRGIIRASRNSRSEKSA